MARVTAVCVLHELLPDRFNGFGSTAIDKRVVASPVEVGELGLAGDRQCDRKHHGGPDKAVYAYADEDAAWWARELGREVPAGLFGENLRTAAVEVSGAEIGERWQVGTGPEALLLEVTMPRMPCRTFQARMGEPRWSARFTARGAPGAYLRVLRPGPVSAGDPVRVEHRPGHGVTLADASLPERRPRMRLLLDAAAAGVIDLAPGLRRYAAQAANGAE